jgi:hypothetical protein
MAHALPMSLVYRDGKKNVISPYDNSKVPHGYDQMDEL